MRGIKTKLITNYTKTTFEEDLNKFISDKDVLDIKFSVIPEPVPYISNSWSALVMYTKGGKDEGISF